jgi:hypothetical protein
LGFSAEQPEGDIQLKKFEKTRATKKMFTNQPAAGIVTSKEPVGTGQFITLGEILK